MNFIIKIQPLLIVAVVMCGICVITYISNSKAKEVKIEKQKNDIFYLKVIICTEHKK